MPIFKSINKKFFKKWTPEMAYVLGFFAADGYMTLNKRGGCYFNIQITDKGLLKSIRDLMGSDHKISGRKVKPNESHLYRLQIGSTGMFEDLEYLGMKQDKTKSLSTSKVPDIFFGDFVRGYFDGDGHVWTGLMHKERKTKTLVIQIVFTSCSRKFLEKLKERLNQNGVEGGCLINNKKNYYRLAFSIKGSLKLYDLMYNRNVGNKKLVFLERKKKVFDKFIKYRLDNAAVV